MVGRSHWRHNTHEFHYTKTTYPTMTIHINFYIHSLVSFDTKTSLQKTSDYTVYIGTFCFDTVSTLFRNLIIHFDVIFCEAWEFYSGSAGFVHFVMAQARFIHLQQLDYWEGRSSSCYLACLMTLMIDMPEMDERRKGRREAGRRFVVYVNL